MKQEQLLPDYLKIFKKLKIQQSCRVNLFSSEVVILKTVFPPTGNNSFADDLSQFTRLKLRFYSSNFFSI